MILEPWLPFAAALVASGLGIFTLLRDFRSPVHRIFALGMALLATEQVFQGFSLSEIERMQVLRLQSLGLVAAGLLPGVWLSFSLAMGRAGYRQTLRSWWKAILLALAVPTALAATSWVGWFFSSGPVFSEGVWKSQLAWPGRLYYMSFLLGSALVAANLERTLLASVGRERWQVKFMVLGLGGLFACRIYSCTYALLFGRTDLGVELVNSGAVLVIALPLVVALRRAGLLEFDIYVSQGFLFRSITLAVVGIYLIAVAFLSHALTYFEWASTLRVDFLLVFAALLALPAVLLSDRLRQGMRAFLSRHFNRPLYDHGRIWRSFTESSATVVDRRQLCRVVVKLVSETLEALSVSIWLVRDGSSPISLGASTALSGVQADDILNSGQGLQNLLERMSHAERGLDLKDSNLDWIVRLRGEYPTLLGDAAIRYCFPLQAQGEFLGVLAVTTRVGDKELSVQDSDLLHLIADQAAATLVSLKLSSRLQQAKEMEVFQNMSAFFVHDLKNLAGRLTLTAQNLPQHFDNPDFRADATRVMQESVDKIRSFCSRLSALQRRADKELTPVDFNRLVEGVLDDLSGTLQSEVVRKLRPVPSVRLDPEQIRSVIVNLLVNAEEAASQPSPSPIVVRSWSDNGAAVLEVSDQGCGMAPEFIENRLFHPFQTTKKEGMGIGLYQSKLIVEAHQGRIEVKSGGAGRGSTFRVVLPLESKGSSRER